MELDNGPDVALDVPRLHFGEVLEAVYARIKEEEALGPLPSLPTASVNSSAIACISVKSTPLGIDDLARFEVHVLGDLDDLGIVRRVLVAEMR